MAFWELLAMMRRWRSVATIGFLLTIAAIAAIISLPGVYSIQGNLILLPPTLPVQANATLPVQANAYQAPSSSLIGLAGVIDRELNQATSHERPVSGAVTLVGEGITHGYSVRLPNSGGQWRYYYDRALLNVQAAGRSENEVQQIFAGTVARVKAELREQQASLGVPAEAMVRSALSPPHPQIRYGGGSNLRAALITMLLGAGMTVAAVIAIDGLSIRNGRVGRYLSQGGVLQRLFPNKGRLRHLPARLFNAR